VLLQQIADLDGNIVPFSIIKRPAGEYSSSAKVLKATFLFVLLVGYQGDSDGLE